jgi:hypothetical protein
MSSAVPAITRLPRSAGANSFLASYSQAQLWFSKRGAFAGNLLAIMEIQGQSQGEVLVEAINTIVKRHEILRTTYRISNGRLFQTVHEHEDCVPGILDLEGLNARQQTGELERLTEAAATTSLDPDNGPVIRVSCLFLGDEKQLVLCAVHPIMAPKRDTGEIPSIAPEHRAARSLAPGVRLSQDGKTTVHGMGNTNIEQ